MPEHELHFSPSSTADSGSFKLIELPSELYTLIESATKSSLLLGLKIKGQHGEDAVLCTKTATYTMKSVALSNTILVVTSPPDASSTDFPLDAVVISDQVNEIIELAPAVPKLHVLSTLLRGREYDDGHELDSDTALDSPSIGLTYQQALETIQASDAELDQGLKNRHILNVDGQLRPIAHDYLNRLLQLILNVLISNSLSPTSPIPVEPVLSTLSDEHEIPPRIALQVMSWFGSISGSRWSMNLCDMIKDVGLGILRPHSRDPIHHDELIAQWKSKVGDSFENHVDLALLSGNYLSSSNDSTSLVYYPASSLPIDPAARFAELFLTRSRWKASDITPFLNDIAINSKERDKLLLKFARTTTTDAEGICYTSRLQS